MRRISLEERSTVVMPSPGRAAAVAVPIVEHPRLGRCLVVTRRATTNGHTGARMTNAGDVVLFGGSIEAGETAADAAIRELCEEAGTPHLLGGSGLTVQDHLGSWTTEAGFAVEGYSVAAPPAFVGSAIPDDREVAEIGYLPVDDVRTAEVHLEYHSVDARDHLLGDVDVEFESPTIRVRDRETGGTWVLWGLAGFMVDRWRRASPIP